MGKKLVLNFVSVILLTSLVAAGFIAVASANSPTIEASPARPLYDPAGMTRSMDPRLARTEKMGESLPPSQELLSLQSGVAFIQLDGYYFNIHLYDTLSGANYQLTDNGFDNLTPRINRNFNRIAFNSKVNSETWQIYTMNLDGSGLTRVGHLAFDVFSPAWSPDGMYFAISSTMQDAEGEIYTMDINGNGITRLTNNGVYDDLPAWSPDGSKIAYISYTNNQYRVWVMNANGTGVQQLSQERYSNHPAWSPDGSMIAYDADGDDDGWQELWVMNADGSNRHMVYEPPYANTDAYMGSWNPGGSSLTFTLLEWIYFNDNWYWNIAQLACTPLIPGGACFNTFGDVHLYPDWGSSDHQPPLTNMPALPAAVPYKFVVSWNGNDQGGAGVSLFDVQAKVGAAGEWTDWLSLTTATSATYTGVAGQSYYFRSRAYDKVGYIGTWPGTYQTYSTVETLPPETHVFSLPPFARDAVTVRWGGADIGGSGIRNFSIQYNDATQGSGWINWVTDTTLTSQVFSGTPGHTYYFRSSGTDNAGNIEAWPAGNGDAQVTFYDWVLEGNAMDILGAPLMGVEATVANGEIARFPSDFSGRYTTYGLTALEELASWSKAGYSALPQTMLNGSVDRGFDVFLPPDPNAFENPGFEAGLSGWQATGSVTNTNIAHTGDYSARLGTPFSFGESTVITTTQWDIDMVAGFETDDLGGIHIMWRADAEGYTSNIFYQYRSPAGAWTEVETVLPAPEILIDPPKMLVTPDGTAHAFYFANDTLYHTYRISSGTWSDPIDLGGGRQAISTLLPASDDDGNIHLVWSCFNAERVRPCYRYKAAGGTWGEVVLIPIVDPAAHADATQLIVKDGIVHLNFMQIPYSYYSRRSSSGEWSEPEEFSPVTQTVIGVDDAGVVHAAWNGSVGSGPSAQNGIVYRQRTVSGVWLEPVLAAPFERDPEMAVDHQGRVHLAFRVPFANGVFHTSRNLDGTWQPVDLITDQLSQDFVMLGDQQGGVHVVSSAGYTHWMGGPQWTPPVLFGGSPTNTRYYALMDIFGGVHILYLTDNYTRLVYQGPHVVSTSGASTLSQSVQVGNASTNPTLSFFTATGGAILPEGNTFTITLSTADETTLIVASTGWNPGWQHYPLDLAPWAGQVITLTYTIAQPSGYPDAWAVVDEVALGSVYPDPWIKLEGAPPTALPGDQFTLKLLYGNHGMVDSPGTVISLTLPTGLSFIHASIPPEVSGDQLTWQLGTLPADSTLGPISITFAVNDEAVLKENIIIPAEIRCSAPELEILNNQAEAITYIGLQIKLPFVNRD